VVHAEAIIDTKAQKWLVTQ